MSKPLIPDRSITVPPELLETLREIAECLALILRDLVHGAPAQLRHPQLSSDICRGFRRSLNAIRDYLAELNANVGPLH